MLHKVDMGLHKPSHLFVGTANRQYFTLSWNQEANKLETVQIFEDVSEPSMRESQTLNQCLVDPTGKFYCLQLYEGALSFVRQKRTKRHDWSLDVPDQIRIGELDVKDSTFLYSSGGPKLALLHQYGKNKTVELVTYKVWDGKAYSGFEKQDREDTLEIEDGGARHIIPVKQGEETGGKRRHVSRNQNGNSSKKKPLLGGAIIVGETTLTYYDTGSKASELYALKEANLFVAWTALDDLRFLLADEFGGLHILSIITDGSEVTNLEVIKIGEVSQPTTMILLDDDMLFIGSHVGDSQLVKLLFPRNRPPTVEIAQTFNNIGPILDFSIMDLGQSGTEVGATTKTHEFSSGQARIVASCGAYETGSLQSIRSGIGLNDYGLLGEMVNIKAMFPLNLSSVTVGGSIVDDILVVSFLNETRVFKFDEEGEIEELPEFMNFPMNEPTLLAANCATGIVHVSNTAVRLIDPESGMVTAMWEPAEQAGGEPITAVSANDNVLLVCVGNSMLELLDLRKDLEADFFEITNGEQIACVHVPKDPGSPVAFVGYWNTGYISVLSLRTKESVHQEPCTTKDPAATPRSLVMAQLRPKGSASPTLLVSMSDGVVVSFDVDPEKYYLSNRTSIALGTQEAALSLIPASKTSTNTGGPTDNVFATGELATLIHWPPTSNRVLYSGVSASKAVAVCPLNAICFPQTIVIADENGVKISVLDDKRLTQVHKLKLGETIRRIAHSSRENIFGIGAIRRGIAEGEEWVNSEFRVVDEVAFQVLGKPLQLGYKGNSEMVESVIASQFVTTYGEPQERFVVGTSFLEPIDGMNGRLMLIGIDGKKSPYLITQQVLKGSCNRIGIVDGKIVAALTKTVTIWEYEEISITAGELKMVTSLRTASTPVDLVVNGNHIAITDLMKSVSVLEYKRGEKGLSPTIKEIARDWDNRWGTAVGHLEGEVYVGADASGNLKVLQLHDEKKVLPYEEVLPTDTRLLVDGEYHLGENVTCVRNFEVKAASDAMVVPRAFLATVRILFLLCQIPCLPCIV